MKYYFPVHLDGGNRGCEGIAKGTALLLGKDKVSSLRGLCTNIPLDTRLGVAGYVTLEPKPKMSIPARVINKVYRTLCCVKGSDGYDMNRYSFYCSYHAFLEQMRQGDVMLSTGGDMMCYGDNEVIYTNDYAKKRGLKTILWGCSMGPENLTPRKRDTLNNFDLVYARETLSYEFFKSLGLKNVVCYPDPAFALEPEKVELPNCFANGQVVGINLSNYTIGAFTLDTPFGEEVRKLLDYIFNCTSYKVLLVPHVLWPGQDDRIIAENVLKEYSTFKDRITILNSDDLNYLQIRYIISQCMAFIGGRTHAVISAYATCVPAIALGYSIKSKGIAKDLGLQSNYVVDCKNIQEKGELLHAFQLVVKNLEDSKQHLLDVMPEYKARLIDFKTIIEKI